MDTIAHLLPNGEEQKLKWGAEGEKDSGLNAVGKCAEPRGREKSVSNDETSRCLSSVGGGMGAV